MLQQSYHVVSEGSGSLGLSLSAGFRVTSTQIFCYTGTTGGWRKGRLEANQQQRITEYTITYLPKHMIAFRYQHC